MAKDGKKYLANNKVYNIPSEKEESFLSDFPNATPIGDSVSFDVNGKSYTIPSNKVSSFLRDFPDAELKKKTVENPFQKPRCLYQILSRLMLSLTRSLQKRP
jgi:hypothetical protein